MELHVQSVTCPRGADSATVKPKQISEVRRRKALKMSIEVQLKVLESRMAEFVSKAKDMISCIEPMLHENCLNKWSRTRTGTIVCHECNIRVLGALNFRFSPLRQ